MLKFKTRLFKLPKPKRFDIVPRYYDAEKEQLEKRYRTIAKEMEMDENDEGLRRTIRFADKLEGAWSVDRSKAVRSSNLRILVILAALCFIIFFLYFSVENLLPA